ncbi:MAG: LytR C-terminal domain-containing protein [Fibrobacterota bacterium]
MKNTVVQLLAFIAVVAGSAFFFRGLPDLPGKNSNSSSRSGVPSVGEIEVLNGCGVDNLASSVTEHLRIAGFDVKHSGNAEDWNYELTVVASRVRDMRNAELVASAMGTERVIMLLNDNILYDVTVFVGRDYPKILASLEKFAGEKIN